MQEESVYALIPSPQEVISRPQMHTSKFGGKTHPGQFDFGQNKVQGHATMGRPDGDNGPGRLLAHEKEPKLPAPGPPTMPKTKIRPPVPSKDEPPAMGLTSNKNFITSNAVDVMLAKPGKVPQPEFQWTMKPDYGKVPMYLKRNKDRVAKEKEQFSQYLRMRGAPEPNASVSQLSPEDRQQLVKHLKAKWGSINTAYQGLSLSVDSAVKKGRKEGLERDLAEIERDIRTLERGEVVLVVD
ncbi:Enkurin [Tetrabaena socialis]|uniref:Enkurin n=1 Tax=Tetrabaena socialis TaxID=47790 RepID=A0A2J7ZJK4_9CHLO|nr:Enkurin [Tetrabaena socialis]|eukprot:PNH00446.1 Enkurin [Tetrabaena socialis]